MACFTSKDTKDVGWVEKNIPCQAKCPAKTDIPGYIDAIAQGDYAASYEINRRDNIFPGILGRVCTKPCEPVCRHAYPGLGEEVSICSLKRSAFDYGRFDVAKKWKKAKSTGKKIAIIGSGPAGLTCANELILLGHDVTIFEKEDIPGGMMTLGIPKFRLPKQVTEYDINSVLRLGIKLKCNQALGVNFTIKELSQKYESVIVAIGNMISIDLNIPGVDGGDVIPGLKFMMEANRGLIRKVPEKVLVIGGGFTAVDCVRSCKRLGAKEVTLAYRRTKTEMYIDQHELDCMEGEGIKDIYLVSPVEVIRNKKGQMQAVKMIKNKLGAPDDSGRRRPVPIKGSEFTIKADLLIPAIGQRSAKVKVAGKNVFTAGDYRTGPTSIIDAVADAKEICRKVHKYLVGIKEKEKNVQIVEIEGPGTGRMRHDDFIEKQSMPTLDLKKRLKMDSEVDLGFDKKLAHLEAKRCYLCDHDYQIDIDRCITCSACIEAMPRKCIMLAKDANTDKSGSINIEEAKSWEEVSSVIIDNKECIRCGACVKACPVDCITVAKISLEK